MAALAWDESRHPLGVAEMDDTHRAFVELAAHLAAAGNADFPALFDAFLTHTREHFAAEDAAMQTSRFPAIGEHTGEHRRVLGELQAFRPGVQAGRLAMARTYVREGLPDWFELHLRTMDAALAVHLLKARRTA